MASLVTAIPNAVGKIIYRKAGRFVSRNTYLRELRRGPAGRFVSAAQHAQGLSKAGLAQHLFNVIGPPIGGGNWVSRVRKSSEKFVDMLADNNALG